MRIAQFVAVRIPVQKKITIKACENEIPERWWKYFGEI